MAQINYFNVKAQGATNVAKTEILDFDPNMFQSPKIGSVVSNYERRIKTMFWANCFNPLKSGQLFQIFAITIETPKGLMEANEDQLKQFAEQVFARNYCFSSFINPNNAIDGKGTRYELGNIEALDEFLNSAIEANCHKLRFKMFYRPAK